MYVVYRSQSITGHFVIILKHDKGLRDLEIVMAVHSTVQLIMKYIG